MTSLRTMFIIVIASAVLVLAAGCMGQAETGKSDRNATSPVPTTPSISTITEIEPPQTSQEGYWIKIDPIGDKQVGDIFTITSTTNLSAGEEILVQVYSATHFNGPKIQTWEFYGASSTVKVIQGSNGINTISFVVNSSTLYNSSPLQPDEYIVTEDAIIQPVTGTALFQVLPASVSYGKTPLKPKNFIDWEKLDLPQLKVNNSMQPEIPKFTMNFIMDSQYQDPFYYGSIVVFSPDGIVRFFDKNGTQIAAYFDFGTLHSYALSSGVMTSSPVDNVTTFTYGGERLITLIFESGH
jgi:hypothetical protein